MKILNPIALTFIICLAFSCENNAQNTKQQAVINAKPIQTKATKTEARAYFASGCFWCVESIYESVIGVKEAISGYSGGHTKNPTYALSNTGKTGHTEAVEVIYNPQEVSFETLVDVYFGSQDLKQTNGQGPDRGSQYRSVIFYQNDSQKQLIEQKINTLTKDLGHPISVEVYPFQKFWVAEDYHQNYKTCNPNSGYIQNVSIPRLNTFKANFPDLIKESEK